MNKEIRNKLKERAVALAKETDQRKVSSSVIEVIIFCLGTESYALESVFVREVWQMNDFTYLPGVPDYILGIINVRGHILPVINLKKFFNLPEKGLGELNKVIVVSKGEIEFAILADMVLGAENVEVEDIQALPPTVTGIGEEYLKGVTGKNHIILNADRLLTDKRIVVNMV